MADKSTSAKKCYVCEKSFYSTGVLNRHLKNIHSIKLQKEQDNPQSLQGEPIAEEELPEGYTYKINNMSTDSGTRILVNLFTEEDFNEWKDHFSDCSKTTWRVYKTYPLPKDFVYKKKFKCQHNVKYKQKEKSNISTKGTGCPAKFLIEIRKCPSEDMPDNLPATLKIMNNHNHALSSAAALKHRDMSSETREKLCLLFREGHNASSALHCLKTDLQLQHGYDYFKIAADGAYVPSVSKVDKLYKKEFVSQYGEVSGDAMFDGLQKLVDRYTENCSGICKFQRTSDSSHYFIVICSPIMNRVHKMVPQTKELVLVDASGGMDKQRHRLYFFITPTAAGGLPIGAIVTDCEKQSVFEEALKALKSIFTSDSFHGQNYPEVFLTDNDLKERVPLGKLFPQTKLLLCQFHFLNALWSWLCNTKNKIDKEHRQELYELVKKCLYAQTEEEFLEYDKAVNSSRLTALYPNFSKYYKQTWNGRETWATCFRNKLTMRGTNTTNYVEIVFRIMKDCILGRIMAYNVTQLTHFILTRYETYLERRLLDFCNGRYANILLRKMIPTEMRTPHKIEAVTGEGGVFKVIISSTNSIYYVDLNKGICSCVKGQTGKLCSHSSSVIIHLEDEAVNSFNLASEKTKEIMFFVATGKQPPAGWFDPLQKKPHSVTDITKSSSSLISTENNSDSSTSSECKSAVGNTTECESKDTENLDNSLNNTCKSDYADTIMVPKLTTVEENEFDIFINRMKEGLINNPEVFVPATRKLLDNVKKYAVTESGLVSGMHTFGTYTGLQPAKKYRRQPPDRSCGTIISVQTTARSGQKNSHTSQRHVRKYGGQSTTRSHETTIGVQPTARSRRRNSCTGKSAAPSGRARTVPKLPARHDYTSIGRLPRRKRKLLHSLQDCVYANKSLGATKRKKM